MKNQKEFLQENHPRIWARVEEIMKEQREEWKGRLLNSFKWSITQEGNEFWRGINDNYNRLNRQMTTLSAVGRYIESLIIKPEAEMIKQRDGKSLI
jgi:hypothetical protein